jgi:hypothetical protein
LQERVFQIGSLRKARARACARTPSNENPGRRPRSTTTGIQTEAEVVGSETGIAKWVGSISRFETCVEKRIDMRPPLTQQELDYDKHLKVTLAEMWQAIGDFFDLHPDIREFRVEKRTTGFWICLPDGSELVLTGAADSANTTGGS